MNDTTLAPRTNYDRLKAMIKADDVKDRFQDILGERAPAFLTSVLSAVATNDNLKDCDPGSILTAALKAAVLDLPIDQNIGFAWIIPYKDHGIPKADLSNWPSGPTNTKPSTRSRFTRAKKSKLIA